MWTPSTDNMGIINWNLDADLSAYPSATLSVNAWIVEQSADFDGGSNGQGTYFDLVRQITDLGSSPQGTANITIPTAHDGDDLEVHLVYMLNMPLAEDSVPGEGIEDDTESKSVPGFGVMIALVAGFSAALVARRT
jgi:PGF-CTERM protein